MIAEVSDRKIELPPGLGQHRARRDADPAGFRQRFEPSGDIDPVTMNVVAVDDDVAKIDADAPFDTGLGRLGASAIAACHWDCATHRVDDAGELDEQPVAGGLDDAAVMPGDGRIDQFGTQWQQPPSRIPSSSAPISRE